MALMSLVTPMDGSQANIYVGRKGAKKAHTSVGQRSRQNIRPDYSAGSFRARTLAFAA